MKSISSRDNPLVKQLHGLANNPRDRRKAGATLLDGAHLIAAARVASWPLTQIVVSDSGYAREEIRRLLEDIGDSVALVRMSDVVFAHISPVDSPSGVLAVADLPPQPSLPANSGSMIVLDGVQDPGNLGAILRTAAAADIGDALLTPGCAQAWSPRTLRAGMGAHFLIRIHEQADPALVLAGYPGQILATGLETGARSLYELDLRGPVAWLFGAEGQGLSKAVKALASGLVIIPMAEGLESLNVGAAAAICLFEQRRQIHAA
ncbi:rRNA methyltransferase [Azoarcus sp. DD4]|uniref:TrmH family RNA methyltransferase n=1 Tax=Azoarcus sp. DD4 TaxID=2027405 RepID=UPI00112B8AAB|nr:RNA methyltransferase [Azoarcus sp. DD4]QDF97276.1 rRNA methyltransferase [Azoarcus sp. DD4]